MLRVYLDQNQWVYLAQARTGRPQGAGFLEAYEAAKTAVQAGTASFPLSAAHYIETHKRADADSRLDLARTMLELSELDAIAPPHVIVPHEIEVALIKVLGLPNELPGPLKVFGHGANHALATTMFSYLPPEEMAWLTLRPDSRKLATAIGQAHLELFTLADHLPVGRDMRMKLNGHMRLTGDEFVSGQNSVRDSLAEIGRHRLGHLMTGTAIVDILDPLEEAAHGLGVDLNRLYDRGREALEPLIDAMPSRWVERELRRLRQSNPQKRWEGNDLNDVTALAISVPYCDVVITERGWSAMINDGKVNKRFDTRVLADLRRLPEVLDSPSPLLDRP